jgi:NADH:ubiquinone oxidoreductase subunit E
MIVSAPVDSRIMTNGSHKLFVCDNVDCCSRGSLELMEKIEEMLESEDEAGEVEVEQYTCFGGCDIGPNMIVYPDRAMYSGVQDADLPDIVAHLCEKGPRVARLETADKTTAGFILSILDAGGWGSF